VRLDVLRAELALFVEFDPLDPKQEVTPAETFISAKNVHILLNAVNQVKNAPKQQNGAGKATVDPELEVSAAVDLNIPTFTQSFKETAEAQGIDLSFETEPVQEEIVEKVPRRSIFATKQHKDA